MSLPPNVKTLLEKNVHEDKPCHIRLTPRVGAYDKEIEVLIEEIKKGAKESYKLLPNKEAICILKCWNQFHKQFDYASFETFYIKNIFCRSHHMLDIKKEAFLTLIADYTP